METFTHKEQLFTTYQKLMIAVLAILQFTVVLDFMVLSPLGAILIKEFSITPRQFTLLVSAYGISAGISAICAAGFADKFDRKKLLLFFYVGFLAGTVFCAMAPSYHYLLLARVVTGVFGGVVGSVAFAIITDLFRMEVRGRVMGFVQMAFGASQALGIPIGIVLANHFGWHTPFWLIAGFGIIIGFLVILKMQPVTGHLTLRTERKAIQHLFKTIIDRRYTYAFLSTVVLATGGFMLMPLASDFTTHNLGLTMNQLPTIYFITGVFSILTGPLIGKYADKVGKYRLFVYGSILGMIMVVIYTNRGITPLWICVLINTVMFAGINARMISASALNSAVPDPQDRGAYMSLSSSIQYISGGFASMLAGVIATKAPDGNLRNYPILGLVVIGSMLIAMVLMYQIHLMVKDKAAKV